MDIVIVDDEPLARDRLRRMVTELGYEVVAEAGSSEAASQAIDIHDPSLVLLDIEMPGDSGLQLAEKIAALDSPPAIIFTTAYDQYALDAFNTTAAGYLLKPVNLRQLQKALEQATSVNKLQLESLQSKPEVDQRDHIVTKSHRGMELIPISDIRCFKADQKYVMVISGGQGEVLIDDTLKDLEEEFARQFVRVHRNALVAVRYIQGLDRDQEGHYFVRLEGIEESPIVSRRYTSRIKSLLKSL